MKEDEMRTIARWISQVVADPENPTVIQGVAQEVTALCSQFPAPGLPLE
jgi:glycine/serine hydroxymethyltransferase